MNELERCSLCDKEYSALIEVFIGCPCCDGIMYICDNCYETRESEFAYAV